MKFEFSDATTKACMLKLDCPQEAFATNIFNLFMVEMVRLHGSTFKKVRSYSEHLGEVKVEYTHNIVARIWP